MNLVRWHFLKTIIKQSYFRDISIQKNAWSALINTDQHRGFGLVPGQCLDGPQQMPIQFLAWIHHGIAVKGFAWIALFYAPQEPSPETTLAPSSMLTISTGRLV